jgi:hypothetical protein
MEEKNASEAYPVDWRGEVNTLLDRALILNSDPLQRLWRGDLRIGFAKLISVRFSTETN